MSIAQEINRVFRDERQHALATLIRVVGDWDVAEEALQEAFEAAVVQWPEAGVPDQPRAWLIRTARNKAVDRVRRQAWLEEKRAGLLAEAEPGDEPAYDPERPDDTAENEGCDDDIDDRLRLLFTCCHPALAPEAQIALTLRTLCGLSTEEIARAFLTPAATMAQRLVRAKAKIRGAGIPYRVPPREEWNERLQAVLAIVYLVFTEGYAATSGDALVRRELTAEAIRLARLLAQLLPGVEVLGLLALLLLTEARRDARATASGDVILLEDQDQTKWDRAQIDEGLVLVDRALRSGPPGPYVLQAAIAAVHAHAPRSDGTDWRQIVALYDRLYAIVPTPVVALNRAVAVAMCDGPAAALPLLDELVASRELREYHLLPAARADLLRRLGQTREAAAAYREALALVGNEPERRFLARRLAALEG
ncbi:MAG TPA: sigma-70 family RNA polymerase sigma factor [Polyangiaceae bacterium]|nr:sigma-70 family RNA polymerase sigma factor [Polyangiaceae bacterium]